MKPKTTLAECLRDEMIERKTDEVWAGDRDLCGAAYSRFGGIVFHPLNRIKAVIDAARKSPLFEKADFIRAHDSSGARQVLIPVFKLKKFVLQNVADVHAETKSLK